MKKIILAFSLFFIIIIICACGNSKNKTGFFKVIDGKEVYIEGKNQVIDKLVEVEGEKYFIGEDGTKIKNEWHQIDNDGNYGYFGAMGQMIKNQLKEIDGKLYIFNQEGIMESNGLKEFDGNKYYATKNGYLICNSIVTEGEQDSYFGKDGKLEDKTGWVTNEDGDLPKGSYFLDEYGNRLTSIWKDDCYLDKDGHMLTNQWIDGYYVGPDGLFLKNTITPDGKKLGADGKVIIEQKFYNTNQNTLTSKVSAEEKEEELYIKNIEKIKENYDYSWTSSGDNYDVENCEILISRPIIAGINQDEIDLINKQTKDLMDQLIEKLEDEDVLANSYHAIFSFELNQPKIKYTDNKVTITLEGKIKYSTDYIKSSTSYPSFIIEYSRKNKTSTMKKEAYTGTELNISSNDIFYSE